VCNCTTAEGVAVCGSTWCITLLLRRGLLYVCVNGVQLYYCGGGCCMCVYIKEVSEGRGNTPSTGILCKRSLCSATAVHNPL